MSTFSSTASSDQGVQRRECLDQLESKINAIGVRLNQSDLPYWTFSLEPEFQITKKQSMFVQAFSALQKRVQRNGLWLANETKHTKLSWQYIRLYRQALPIDQQPIGYSCPPGLVADPELDLSQVASTGKIPKLKNISKCSRCGGTHQLANCTSPCVKCGQVDSWCRLDDCLNECRRCGSLDHRLVQCTVPCHQCHRINSWCSKLVCTIECARCGKNHDLSVCEQPCDKCHRVDSWCTQTKCTAKCLRCDQNHLVKDCKEYCSKCGLASMRCTKQHCTTVCVRCQGHHLVGKCTEPCSTCHSRQWKCLTRCLAPTCGLCCNIGHKTTECQARLCSTCKVTGSVRYLCSRHC